SLFSGIGGLELGLERAGMTVVGQVEIDPFCRRVLEKHWPEVPKHDDVRTCVEWWGREARPAVHVVAGGFPCQPVSNAGLRLAQDDERWLWPVFADVVRHLRPDWVLLENVAALLGRGAGDVLGDLAACGYDAEWDCIPAAAVGAPHLRDRWFCVAYPQRDRLREQPVAESGRGGPALTVVDGASQSVAYPHDEGRDRSTELQAGRETVRQPSPVRPDADGCRAADVADATCIRRANRRKLRPAEKTRGRRAEPAGGRPDVAHPDSTGRRPRPRLGWPRPAAERNGWWAAEPDVGRVAYGVPARVDRLRALGNAVVPQVAEHIGRLIMEVAA
ncbi:MAG TPA: DNA cytosine methyltransferase, partial [Jiangellaceae bacterium]|nr:DNA cytosine methyltransferase [Jiangellaceae bacterium]